MSNIKAHDLNSRRFTEVSHQLLYPLDLTEVTLAGEFGRRVECIIESNILRIDVEKVFLAGFCERKPLNYGFNGAFIGTGMFVEAVINLAASTKDQRLIELKDRMIARLLDSQESKGYIGVFVDPAERVRTIWDLHEGGYLILALVADCNLFGRENSLSAAKRLADYFIGRFTAEPGLRIDKPIDMTFNVVNIGWDLGLLALSAATGEAKYLDHVVQALKLEEFNPPIECGTTTFANHVYSYISHCLAQLELYRQRPDPKLLRTSHKVLDFLRHGDGLLVTGSCSLWECWHNTQSGLDNLSETCVGVYLAKLMEAMLQIEGESLYGDILERNIYNALFAATDPDGARSRYFTCFEGTRSYIQGPCCINNNKRFLADLRSWMYYSTERGIAVNLYNASTVTTRIAREVTVRLEQQTDYPSSGNVRLRIDPSKEAQFEVKLRIPRWCKEATISINGSRAASVGGGQFYGITRSWKVGDVIELQMPMEWRFIRGRRAQEGRAAIMRGPTIFTFNPDRNSELSAKPGFEVGHLKIAPLEIEGPVRDDSIRPEGLSCRINAWTREAQPWPIVERVPVVLTEFADPGGQGIYFMVPGEGIERLMDDELI